MGYEQEAVDALFACMKGNRSKMQREMLRGTHGESFILHDLLHRGTLTPSQMAASMGATSGRVSTVLAALERKGLITRGVDPDDRRVVCVSLTDAGRERARADMAQMRDTVCWIFGQMGERRTREFVALTEEFMTYMSLCHPGGARPTPEEVREAFARRDDAAGAGHGGDAM